MSTERLQREFPLYGKAAVVEVEVKSGQMLWVPAGWFHEVSVCMLLLTLS